MAGAGGEGKLVPRRFRGRFAGRSVENDHVFYTSPLILRCFPQSLSVFVVDVCCFRLFSVDFHFFLSIYVIFCADVYDCLLLFVRFRWCSLISIIFCSLPLLCVAFRRFLLFVLLRWISSPLCIAFMLLCCCVFMCDVEGKHIKTNKNILTGWRFRTLTSPLDCLWLYTED